MNRRVVSLWFPRLPSERVLRVRPIDGPFALTRRQSNTERIYCLNEEAARQGLQKGIGLGEARVLCPGLQTAEADPRADARFMQVLARWAGQYCPWVGLEEDGLALDITGAAHLRGGEMPLLADMARRLARAGISHRAGLADTRGAAWAIARHGEPANNARHEAQKAMPSHQPPRTSPPTPLHFFKNTHGGSDACRAGGTPVAERSEATAPQRGGALAAPRTVLPAHPKAGNGNTMTKARSAPPALKAAPKPPYPISRNTFTIIPAGELSQCLAPLPVAALRLPAATCIRLQRLGIRTVKDLATLPRQSLTRRFGAEVLLRLDQASGIMAEPISPLPPPAPFAFRMTLPEPIGLHKDVFAGLERLLVQLCARLEATGKGARRLVFTARRVDQASVQVEVRLARAMREAPRIARLFERGLDGLDSGYGIDQIRLEAVELEALPLRQASSYKAAGLDDGLADIITKLGNRIGLENITRLLPADSHLPEKSFSVAPAAYSEAAEGWASPGLRPLILFAPEAIAAGHSPQPPRHFCWRRLWFRVAHIFGPERIAPEWWFDHPDWRSGMRDYWRVLTFEGRRLWLFFTPQNPGWFVAGEFA